METTNFSKLSRSQWLNASSFHTLAEEEVFSALYRRLEQPGQFGSAVLLDLDSTLYEVHHRTHAILNEWATLEGHRISRETRRNLPLLDGSHVGYSIKDAFELAGLSLAEPHIELDLKRAQNFWWGRFMSNDYLFHDTPYAGAQAFVHRLIKMGAHVVYLTGRSVPRMLEGTKRKLEADGFPLDPRQTTLFLKPHPDGDDAEHKSGAALEIDARFGVVASFENEPVNFVAMQRAIPKAMHVFVETVCSEHPAEPTTDAYRIRGFSTH